MNDKPLSPWKIRRALSDAKTMRIIAKADTIAFSDCEVLVGKRVLRFAELMKAVGITPAMLRPIVLPTHPSLPAEITAFNQLGELPLSNPAPFGYLARLLGKRVEVCRDHGFAMFMPKLFTAMPSTEVESAAWTN